MKHLYRKGFDYAYEAEHTKAGFEMMPGIHPTGPVEVYVSSANGKHWVYVAFEGEYDADELFAATGYARVV